MAGLNLSALDTDEVLEIAETVLATLHGRCEHDCENELIVAALAAAYNALETAAALYRDDP